MISKARRVTAGDTQAVREMLGLDTLGSVWLGGTLIRDWKNSPEHAGDLIASPARSILYRYLARYPEENPVPVMPEMYEVGEKLAEIWPDYVVRRLGQIFGASDWAGYSWARGGQAAPVVKRLGYILMRAIEKDDIKGLEKFLSVVEEEAQVRGFSDLAELFTTGWRVRSGETDEEEEGDESELGELSGGKRKKARNNKKAAETELAAPKTGEAPKRRGPGRPRKNPLA